MKISKDIFFEDQKITRADMNLLEGLLNYAKYIAYGWGHFNVSEREAVHMKCYVCTNNENREWNAKCPDENCPLNIFTFEDDIEG